MGGHLLPGTTPVAHRPHLLADAFLGDVVIEPVQRDGAGPKRRRGETIPQAGKRLAFLAAGRGLSSRRRQ
jgi:hypothetical protein